MARRSQRRLEKEGKRTNFKRRGNDGGQFQDVPVEKLQNWTKRFQPNSPTLESSFQSTPSNIAYSTPSISTETNSDFSSPSSFYASAAASITSSLSSELVDEKLREFNNEFLRIWLNPHGRCWKRYREARQTVSNVTAIREWNGLDASACLDILDGARALIFAEEYMGAEGEFKTAATGFYHILGPHYCEIRGCIDERDERRRLWQRDCLQDSTRVVGGSQWRPSEVYSRRGFAQGFEPDSGAYGQISTLLDLDT